MRFPSLSKAALATVGALLAVAAGLLGGGCQRGSLTGNSRPADAVDGRAEPDAVTVSAPRGVHIALLYSSNLQGEFESCDCPTQPLGGLARRAALVERARAEADGVLVVDAGDLLLPATSRDREPAPPVARPRPPDGTDVERRARLLLDVYARLGVAALLPADGDLGIGLPALRRLLKGSGVPAIASNLDDASGAPLFDRDRIVTVAGVPVGIFGVVQPTGELQSRWQRWGIRVTDPTAAARAEISSLKHRGARMIVALLHLGDAKASRALLEAAPGITWAVQGHAGMQFESPETIGGARLVEAMSQGRLAGRLDIHVVDGTAAFTDRSERAQVLAILADHRQQLADLEQRAVADQTDQLRQYYPMRRQGLLKAIARDVALAHQLPTALSGSWYENRIIPLDPSIPDHAETARLVRQYKAQPR